MDMFSFAIQMEEDAEKLYRDLAARTGNDGIRKVLTRLAEEGTVQKESGEGRHKKAIISVQKRIQVHPEKQSSSEITTIFEEMRKNPASLPGDTDALELYEKALEIEKKGMEYYKQQFTENADEESRKLFSYLEKQELFHYSVVENLVQMIRKPEWWVENAEFTPKGDSYY